jgi:hypothetical protein
MSDSTFTISGTAQVGQVLSASPGFTYQWYRSGVAIAGATSSTYTLVAADSGNTITATRIDSSEATSAVAAAGSVPVNTVLPTISGTPQVGQTLTATNGTWTNSPTSFTYQWNRAGTAIGGATASTYVPVSADVGNTLTVSVVAANSGGSSSPAISSATSAVIGIIPKNSAVPTISGTAQVGQTLTATTGTWTNSPTSFTYQWNRAGTAIGGTTASTYVPVAADVGNMLTVSVVATNSGGSSSPATSAATSAVIDIVPTNSSVPTISGTAQVGQTLTATTGTWTHNPTSFTYQWNRAGAAIGGTTASTYVPVAADVGNTLTVSVVAANSGGSSSPAISSATSAVIGIIPKNSAVPTISGTAQVGHTLTATTGTWTNSPTSFTYQWNRAGSAISGATASAYVPVAADVGNALAISVTAANGSGSSTPAASAATSAVIDMIPTNSSVPTISGTAQVGQTLTATTGTWTHNPTSFTYQWKRAGTAIGGATASTYIPVAGDVGNTLTVSVVATNSGGSSSSATSSATSSVIDIIPTNSAVPTISGTAKVGQTLTATNGTWTHNPTSFTYQWKRAGTAIGGATASTYVPVAADVGNTLTVSVVVTNSGGSSSPATSSATSSVIDIIPTNSSVPTISGTAQVGQTLTATSGTWTHNPTSFTYQWNRAGTAIGGATASTYVPVAADVGNTLTVSVVAANSGGSSSSATSAATSAVAGTAAASLSKDFFGLHILGPIETNLGGSGKPLVWPTWNPTSWRALDNYGGVPPTYTYAQGISNWGAVETSDGVYDWSLFDLVWAKLISKGVTNVLMGLQGTPLWANGGVTAAPPTNMAKLGAWVTSYLTRATLDGLPIKFVEGVNEWNNGGSFYNGTVAQLVSMQQALYNAAKAYDPTITVLSPPVNSVGPSQQANISSFLSAGGGAYCDVIAFHGYPSDPGTYSQVTYRTNVTSIIAIANGVGKPVWNTEYSTLSGVGAPDEIFLAATTFINWSLGVARHYYYAYDNSSTNDILWDYTIGPSGTLTVSGVAYQNLVTWLVGANIQVPLALTGVVWTIDILRSNGKYGRAVWTSDRSTPSYAVPSWATQYLTLAGGTVGSLGANVTIGALPILLTG